MSEKSDRRTLSPQSRSKIALKSSDIEAAPVRDWFSTWVPLKPHVRFWRLLIFAGWPCRTPFSRAENPPIAFIRELKKQVRIGLVLLGEGQSAILDRVGAAHGISNPNATERGFKYRKKDLVRGRPLARCATEGIARQPF
jgi:hypothetical protein